jgi:diguanylate cyclase (GGDEF)-like protein/PAS domain S-box-containing protein
LWAAEEKFRAAFKYAPTGMAIIDPTGAFVDTNPALARLLNRRPGTLLGAALWDYVEPEDLDRLHEDFLRLAEGVDHELSTNFRYRNGAGADGWMRVSIAPLAGTDTFILHLLDVTAQKQTEADLSRKATHDLLTGLPNRGLVLSKLGSALRSLRTEPGLVHTLFVDLDGFKQVNDRHGHAVGDRVLRAAAERMKAALRPSDTIGRIGGDEFVVIIKSLPHEAPAEEIAHRLAQAVAAPVALDEGIVSVKASIGHASTDDPDYPAARLLGSADADMYRAKQAAQRQDEKDKDKDNKSTHPGLRVVPRSAS